MKITKDKSKYYSISFIFVTPLIIIAYEYITKSVNLQTVSDFILAYILGIVVFYIVDLIRKRVFGIYFNSKDNV